MTVATNFQDKELALGVMFELEGTRRVTSTMLNRAIDRLADSKRITDAMVKEAARELLKRVITIRDTPVSPEIEQ